MHLSITAKSSYIRILICKIRTFLVLCFVTLYYYRLPGTVHFKVQTYINFQFRKKTDNLTLLFIDHAWWCSLLWTEMFWIEITLTRYCRLVTDIPATTGVSFGMSCSEIFFFMFDQPIQLVQTSDRFSPCLVIWALLIHSILERTGTEIVCYESPRPVLGIHRLVFLLFQQLGRQTVYAPGWRQNFSTRDFAELYNLGLPVAAVYFNCQRESGTGGRRMWIRTILLSRRGWNKTLMMIDWPGILYTDPTETTWRKRTARWTIYILPN